MSEIARELAGSAWEPVRTNRLLVVAGPPCAGKTTLVARIREGALPSLCEQIGLGDPRAWTYVDATELARMARASVEALVLHYDLLVQRTPSGYRYLPELMGHAGSVGLVTLCTASESLRRRSHARLVDQLGTMIRHPLRTRDGLKRLRRLWRRHQVFRDSGRVRRLYEDWFEFASSRPGVPHWVLDSTADGPLVAERFEVVRSRAQELQSVQPSFAAATRRR